MKIPDGFILISEKEYNKLKEDIRLLTEQIVKLSKTSKNSSKPPSSDLVKQKEKKEGKTKGKIGAPKGHKKHEREPFSQEQIHDVYEYSLINCPLCQTPVEIDLNYEPKIVQQVELLDVPLLIEEHKAYAYWCPNCQKYHYSEFPSEVLKAGLFKARITAFVAYMKNVCHCSFSNIRKYIRDVLQLKVSRGYLSKIIQKVGNSLDIALLPLWFVLSLFD